jgi:radical SAM protein with 4Fe4S-binding SPASM domain
MTRLEYYRRLGRIYAAYKKRRTVLPYLPIRLWIEPTSFCNLKCVMCPNKDLAREDKGYMPLELFRKIVDEAGGFVNEVNLIHRGESLLHPDFFEMVAMARKAGIITKLHTNATLLDEPKARALIAAGLDQLTFSFDGYDKATYESIRVNASFEKTAANIRRFLEIKKELGAKKPTTIFELIDFPDVYKNVGSAEKKRFLDGFRGLGLNRIRVKEMHNWAGEIDGGRKGAKYTPCTFLWASLIIFWDGAVLPCTQDFFGDLAVGNVKDATLAAIWNGEPMVALRQKAAAGDISGLKPCSGCDRPWRDTFLGVPKEFVWKLLFRKMP